MVSRLMREDDRRRLGPFAGGLTGARVRSTGWRAPCVRIRRTLKLRGRRDERGATARRSGSQANATGRAPLFRVPRRHRYASASLPHPRAHSSAGRRRRLRPYPHRAASSARAVDASITFESEPTDAARPARWAPEKFSPVSFLPIPVFEKTAPRVSHGETSLSAESAVHRSFLMSAPFRNY